VRRPGAPIAAISRLAVWMLMATQLWACGSLAGSHAVEADEEVIFFPTAAHRSTDGQSWELPVHGWIFARKPESGWRKVVIDKLPGLLGLEPDESGREIFEQRGWMFLVDNKRSKEVDITVDGILNRMDPSAPNGHFRGVVQLAAEPAGGEADGKWIVFQARGAAGDPRVFEGRSQLVEATGWSVISDIDDTIKVSDVHDKKALLANTFLQPFRPVNGMPELYRRWARRGAVFHYVSASPWQLYPALSGFMATEGFPDGSFHLKTFRIKDETFFDLFADPKEYKQPLIERILQTFPDRRFVLVGDAGEQDPEIFASVARSHPGQVSRVLIRDVADGAADSERYRSLFQDMPQLSWAVFADGDELLTLEVP
jgi:hypothetical protein